MTIISRIIIGVALPTTLFIDSATPLGFPTWLLYFFPMLYISVKAGRFEVLIHALLISALIIAGFFLSPPGIPLLPAGANRLFGIGVLWGLSLFNLRRQEMVEELRSAGDKIRESEESLRTVFDSSHDAIFIHDLEGRIIEVNRQALAMYNIDYHQALSLTMFDLLSPDNSLDSIAEIVRRTAAGESRLYQWRANRPRDGSVFEVEVYLTRIRLRERTAILATMREITRRKQMEDELRLSRFSMDHASICAYLVNRQARFLYVNEQTCRTLGYSREELLAMTVHDLDPDFPPAVWDDHWTELQAAGSMQFETTHRRKDGTIVPMEMALNFLAFGGREYNVAFGLDITTRKKAEEALKQAYAGLETKVRERTRALAEANSQLHRQITERQKAEEQVRKTLESIEDGFYALDEHRRFIYLNAEAEHILTIRREEVLGRPCREVCPLPFRTRMAEEYERAAKGEARDFLTFDEPWGRWFHVRVFPRQGGGISVYFRDITESKRTEEALRTSEKRFRDLVETTSDWVWEIDGNGLYTYVSPQVEQLLGYAPEEVLGRTVLDLMAPEETERIAALLREKVASRAPFSYLENITLHKNGARVVMETSGVPFFDAAGDFSGYRGICRDITGRKAAEEELQKVQKLESIGLLAGGIAHDFNNILTAIQGNIELAEMFLPQENKARQRLAIAEKAAIRARGLTQQLLTFSKGGAPIKKTASVPRLVRDSVNFALQDANVTPHFSFADDLHLIEADENQFRQVINNLTINARQAMPEGGTLTVSAGNETIPPDNPLDLQPGEYVRIELTDQGIGIPEANLGRIFDPYFTTREHGSGLGLSISFSIIKKHGGAITVHSTPGAGTTFTLFLPACGRCWTADKGPGGEDGFS